MRTIAMAVTIFTLAASAGADETMDIMSMRDKLQVLTDGKGHYIVAVPFAQDTEQEYTFYGDGKNFWQLTRYSYFREGDAKEEWLFWEPRVPGPSYAKYEFSEKTSKVVCDDRKTFMKPLDKAAADTMLTEATFHRPRWTRSAYSLARDDKGVYYFVDRAREPENNKNFRVFMGMKGKLKLQKLKNVVADKQGEIFSTKNGQLRYVSGQEGSTWIKGKRNTPLTKVDLEDRDNIIMVYTELGVYSGKPLGTPCDDL